jgi:Dyp-type peroxidase family
MTVGLNLGEVQGNVVRSYGRRFYWARYIFLKAKAVNRETQQAVASLLAAVTFGDEAVSRANGPGKDGPRSAVNVSFTHKGLGRLGVPARLLDAFPRSFREGAFKRASELHDHWHERDDVIRLDGADLLLSVHSRSPRDGEARCRRLIDELGTHFDVVHCLLATFSPDGRDRERFGFADGLSQPAIEGVDIDAVGDGVYATSRPRSPGWRRRASLVLEDLGLQALSRNWRLIRTGEFLLGYENEDGALPEGSDGPLGPNSTLMVFREIDEDVDSFNDYVQHEAERIGLTADHLRAKIVGRWQNGTSAIHQRPDPDDVADHPRRANDFLYSHDPNGFGCPLGAHTRRGNPRDGLPGGAEQTMRHRIIRRGMPYSPGADKAEPDRQGLAFVCFSASIENGFEFIQRNWINDGEAFGLSRQRDFLLQDWRDGAQGSRMVIPGYRPQILAAPGKPFVKVRGCGYLFVPSRSACTWLAGYLTSR